MKRITSLVLAVVVLLGVMSAGTFSVSAESTLVASDECIRVLKEEEGFSLRPYWDYSQYTVGFGTKCPDDMLTYYRENGITEEDAEVLLRNHLASIELDINTRIVDGYGVALTQNQFDALVLFSYNCGSSWVFDNNGTLNKALKSGATGNDIIRAFALWCNAGGQIKDFLLRRRLSESNMFLNGVYSRTPPESYGYVLYDANGGSVSPRSQGYDYNSPVAPYPTPTYPGYTFTGWYTNIVDGTKVTVLDASVKGKTLYAHWVDAQGNPPAKDPQGSVVVTVTASDVNLRKGPGTNYTVVGTANIGDKLTITQTATDGSRKWGKFDKGWICLQYTNYDTVSQSTTKPSDSPATTTPTTPTEATEPAPSTTTAPATTTPPATTTAPPTTTAPEQKPAQSAGQMGTVRVDGELNIRTGPSTGYSKNGFLKNGDRVNILEQKTNGSMQWGRIDKGWICMDYVALDSASGGTVIMTGTVYNCSQLRIRSGAGTNYAHVGNLNPGTRVEILEKKTNGSTQWGRISNGWICLDYVKETSGGQTTPPASNTGSTGNGSAAAKWTGTVVNCSQLRIRSGAGISYAHVGNLNAGTRVEILDKKTNGSTVWGKIDKGWICMDYVQLDSGTVTGETVNLTGTVEAEEFLRIRTGPSTSYSVAGYLKPGEKVTITEKRQNGSTAWGKVEKGWICLDYVRMDGTAASGTTATSGTTKTVTTDCLRIRNQAGTSGTVVGYLYYGQKVTVTQQTTVDGTSWGKTDKGWICLDYTK